MQPRDISTERAKGFEGFSLVEMMVALVFTMILMAGLASVFKASLGTFVVASETTSSGRRNRMATDLLMDDLNRAGMLPSTLFDYPSIDPTNPPFRINPNVAFTGTDIPDAQAKADQLDIYYDDALPFDGTLGTAIKNTSDQVASGGQLGDNSAFTLNFRDSSQASQVATLFTSYGMYVLFRSSGYSYKLLTAKDSGSSVAVTIDSASSYSGTGAATGATFTTGATADSGVTLIRPGRYVRYSIQAKSLDPSSATQTPCLIREEVTYENVRSSSTPFSKPDDTTIVAENVSGFKVLLSGDGGKTWAGGNTTDTSWSNITGAATGAASPTLNWQFQSGTLKARAGLNSTGASPFWFREIPVLVRVDVTTRTVNKRGEYGATPTTAAYKTQTQSLVLNPRHFGLAYQPVN